MSGTTSCLGAFRGRAERRGELGRGGRKRLPHGRTPIAWLRAAAPGEEDAARSVDQRCMMREACERAREVGRGCALRTVARKEQRIARHARAEERELALVRGSDDGADGREAAFSHERRPTAPDRNSV